MQLEHKEQTFTTNVEVIPDGDWVRKDCPRLGLVKWVYNYSNRDLMLTIKSNGIQGEVPTDSSIATSWKRRPTGRVCTLSNFERRQNQSFIHQGMCLLPARRSS